MFAFSETFFSAVTQTVTPDRIHRETIQCKYSQKCFSLQFHLTKPRDETHQNLRQREIIPVLDLSKCFSQQSVLTRHNRMAYTKEKFQKCEYCQKRVLL